MKIIADEIILYVKEAFGRIGDLETVPAKELSAERIKSADILVVRSVTPVNRSLLDGTHIRMVVTATIGTDHVDLDYLSERGILFASAAGGNANSVVEYVLAVIIGWLAERKRTFNETTLGVIGVGNIGSRVVRVASGLGMTVLKNDPPLAEKRDDLAFSSLERVLESDIVTLHVPLMKSGRYPTLNLMDSRCLGMMKPDSLLINTSRGAVLDEKALKRALGKGKQLTAVLDVWRNEPVIDPELLDQVHIATPHIAGHSLDGKANCTFVAYKTVCEFLGVEPGWSPVQSLPEPDLPILEVRNPGVSEEIILHDVIRQVYDILQDDRAFRHLMRDSAEEYPSAFQRFRDEYRVRREFHSFGVDVGGMDTTTVEKLRVLGFRVG